MASGLVSCLPAEEGLRDRNVLVFYMKPLLCYEKFINITPYYERGNETVLFSTLLANDFEALNFLIFMLMIHIIIMIGLLIFN